MTDYDTLERLVRLRDSGGLSEQEFQAEKAKLLAKPHPAADKSSSGARKLWLIGAGAVALIVIVAASLFSVKHSPATEPNSVTGLVATRASQAPPAAGGGSPAAEGGLNQNPLSDSEFTSSQSTLVTRYQIINSNCRGGSGDAARTSHQCARRDAMEAEMRTANLCYGKQSDASGAEMSWHVCDRSSLSYSDRPTEIPAGRCRVAIEGQSMFEGACLISLQEGGSFWVMDTNQRFFASVDRYDESDTALVAADGRQFSNEGDFGAVKRSGACWKNVEVEICAWG